MLIPAGFGETTALRALQSSSRLTSAWGTKSPDAVTHTTPDAAGPEPRGFPLMPEFCLIRNRELSIPLAGLCVGSGLHPCAGSSKQTNPVRDVFLARWLNVMSHLSGVKQVFKREKSALATLGLLNLSDLTTFRSATELGHLSSLRASLNW